MFLQNKNGTKIETIIGHATEIEGNINTNQSVRVDGKIKGEIKADGVYVGESALVTGDITGNRVTIAGQVKGNVSSSTTLEILPKGHVFGDIRTNKLIIADGAVFDGNCQMIKSEGQIIEINPQELQDGSHKSLKMVANGKR